MSLIEQIEIAVTRIEIHKIIEKEIRRFRNKLLKTDCEKSQTFVEIINITPILRSVDITQNCQRLQFIQIILKFNQSIKAKP